MYDDLYRYKSLERLTIDNGVYGDKALRLCQLYLIYREGVHSMRSTILIPDKDGLEKNSNTCISWINEMC